MSPLFESNLQSLPLLHRGKVRDIYAIDEARLLIIQTDRLSAFDVILPDPIPEKGRVLTSLSNFWFHKLMHVIPNHLMDVSPDTVVDKSELAQVAGRAFIARRLRALPIEAIVRGYIAGSGWKEYKKTKSICGIELPEGLQEAQKLSEPLFTPSTKAAAGTHDENIGFAEVENLLGSEYARQVRDKSIELYTEAASFAAARGIIIADTKFEFGIDEAGKLYLIDEALTPDSSRFWPTSSYRLGANPPSFDKQFIRDWLEAQHWNKQPPAPRLPSEVILKTSQKYQEALRLLTVDEPSTV